VRILILRARRTPRPVLAASVATAFTAQTCSRSSMSRPCSVALLQHDVGSEREHLLKAPEPVLCYQCHSEKNAQFNMPFHHKVNEGLVKCTDCHDVHGTFERNNVRSRNDSNQICTKCHTDKRGPFVYEHTPIKGEGCTGCHTPHGSQNARLLNMPNINVLCNNATVRLRQPRSMARARAPRSLLPAPAAIPTFMVPT